MSLLSLTVNGVQGALVSPLDRGFGYGDGLFETCRCEGGSIPLWSFHRERLAQSATRLGFDLDGQALEQWLSESLAQHRSEAHLVVKIQISRGVGGRGYRIPAHAVPNYVVAVFAGAPLHSAAFNDGVDLRLCKLRLGKNPVLAGIKHLNRLEQVMARSEWGDEYAEGLLFDIDDHLIEATASNVFLVRSGALFTPDLSNSGVAGVMRRFVIDVLAPKLQLSVHITNLGLDNVACADEIFLTNSVVGIWPVKSIAGMSLRLAHGVTQGLQRELVAQLGECKQ